MFDSSFYDYLLDNIRDKHVYQYKKYHLDPDVYPGNSFKNSFSEITSLIKETKAKTLLDYGCGKGLQYTESNMHESWGIMPTLYDPAVSKYEHLPKGPFDGIYSTDVMEHIPEEVIPSVLKYIFGKAKKFVFLGVSTRPAIQSLPNGENAHCTVKPIEWWIDMIMKYAPKACYTHLKCYGNSNGYQVMYPST